MKCDNLCRFLITFGHDGLANRIILEVHQAFACFDLHLCASSQSRLLFVENVFRMIRSSRTSIVVVVALAIVVSTLATGAGEAAVTSAGADDADDARSVLIATADFNQDGIADIARIVQPAEDRAGACTLQLLFGQKDGSFRQGFDSTLPEADPQSMVAGDFNGDGNPDLLIGDENGSVTEFLGDGAGNLRSAGEIAHVGSVVSIAAGDFNHDGVPDIAVSDFSANTVTIFLGSGNGSFRPEWSFSLPMRGTAFYLAAADFNKDGVPDLAITSGEEGMFVVMLANGNGTFTYAPTLSNIRDPRSYCPT